jgi:4-azaleucine resistance transporter AzlC
MDTSPQRLRSQAWNEAGDGLRDIAPAAFAAVPIGLLFGAVAVGKGLSPAEVILMSALVFAGGAQFAAIEMWSHPAPILALAFSTLLINARHVLMGASLARSVQQFSPWQRALGFAVMADENWALSERRAASRPLTTAYYGAMSLFFWANWVLWAACGAFAGALLGDPSRFGADFAFTALFIALIAAFWRGRRTGLVIAASGLAAALAHVTVGSPWHVAAGAGAGIAAAALAHRPEAKP